MSVLYLHFETDERAGRLARLQKSGAHVVVAAPRWPGFFELAKREKPYAIAIDFSQAPSHSLETADYMSKARETKDAKLFLLRVPTDRKEAVMKRLPKAELVTENELSGKARPDGEGRRRAGPPEEGSRGRRQEGRPGRRRRRQGCRRRQAAKPAAPPAKAKPASKARAAHPKKTGKKPAAKKPQPKKKEVARSRGCPDSTEKSF